MNDYRERNLLLFWRRGEQFYFAFSRADMHVHGGMRNILRYGVRRIADIAGDDLVGHWKCVGWARPLGWSR